MSQEIAAAHAYSDLASIYTCNEQQHLQCSLADPHVTHPADSTVGGREGKKMFLRGMRMSIETTAPCEFQWSVHARRSAYLLQLHCLSLGFAADGPHWENILLKSGFRGQNGHKGNRKLSLCCFQPPLNSTSGQTGLTLTHSCTQ